MAKSKGQLDSNARQYHDAAVEHIDAAFRLYERGLFAASVYLSGLAVECMFRAYRVRVDPAFDSRHDLSRLFDLAQFGDLATGNDLDSVHSAVDFVVLLWANDVRFLSTADYEKRLKKRKVYDLPEFQRIGGKFAKEVCRQLHDKAGLLVDLGVIRWPHLKSN